MSPVLQKKYNNLFFTVFYLIQLPFCLVWAQDQVNTKIFYLSSRTNAYQLFDLYCYETASERNTNITEGIQDLALQSNSMPKFNQVRNSVFLLIHNPGYLVEFDLQSRDTKKVIAINSEATDYIFSPDGLAVVYTEKVDSVLQLIKIDLTNGIESNLSNNRFNNFEPSYSKDGEKIVYVCDKDGSNSIAVMNNNGRDQKILTNDFGEDRYPNISPDNMQIVFSSSRGGTHDADFDLYTIDITGKNFKLLHDSKSYDTRPSFSPNNKYVAFISNARGQLFRDIYLKDLKSGDVELITHKLQFFNQNYIFSLDGEYMVFENMSPSTSEIMLYSLDQKQLKKITDHTGRNVSPTL